MDGEGARPEVAHPDPEHAAAEGLLGADTADGAASAAADGAASAADPSRRRRRRRVVAGGLVLAALAAVLAIVLATGSSPRRGSTTGVPVGDTTTAVTRRTLSESATVSGTLGYGGEQELYDRLAGTYTWLPAVGAHIARGETLFRVDNLPVVLMYGSVPAYRALKEGLSKGPDVTELNANLIDLGYDPYGAIEDEESFSEATAAAVRRWQRAEGLPETGEVELGRVIFAAGAQRVTALHVALGQDPPGAEPSSGQPGSGEDTQPEAGEKGKPSSGESPSKPSSGKAPSKQGGEKGKPSSGKSHPRSSTGKSPSKSSNQDKAKSTGSEDEAKSSKEGDKSPSSNTGEEAAGGGEAVLSSTSTQQIVQLKVKPEQQQLAHVGERVQVLLPGGGTVPGRIASVGTVASSSSSSPSDEKGSGGSDEGSESTIAVTVTLDRPVAHLDEAPVSVELVKSIRREVLTVPATALIATAGGGYAIEVLEGDSRRAIPVTPGMFAGSYVQIEGRGLREGMTVIESE